MQPHSQALPSPRRKVKYFLLGQGESLGTRLLTVSETELSHVSRPEMRFQEDGHVQKYSYLG